MLALRARIKLRNDLEREPSTIEVDEYLQDHSNVEISYKEVGNALRAGEEVCIDARFIVLVLWRVVTLEIIRKWDTRVSNAQDTTQIWQH